MAAEKTPVRISDILGEVEWQWSYESGFNKAAIATTVARFLEKMGYAIVYDADKYWEKVKENAQSKANHD